MEDKNASASAQADRVAPQHIEMTRYSTSDVIDEVEVSKISLKLLVLTTVSSANLQPTLVFLT